MRGCGFFCRFDQGAVASKFFSTCTCTNASAEGVFFPSLGCFFVVGQVKQIRLCQMDIGTGKRVCVRGVSFALALAEIWMP